MQCLILCSQAVLKSNISCRLGSSDTISFVFSLVWIKTRFLLRSCGVEVAGVLEGREISIPYREIRFLFKSQNVHALRARKRSRDEPRSGPGQPETPPTGGLVQCNAILLGR